MKYKILLSVLFIAILMQIPAHATNNKVDRIDSLEIKLNQKGLDIRSRIDILNALIKAYWKILPDSSLSYGRQALYLQEQLNNDTLKAEISGNIGVAYFYDNSYESALNHLYKALELWQKLGDRNKTGITLNSLGNVFFSLNNTVKAMEYYTKSLDIMEKSGNKKMIATTLINMGSLYNAGGQSRKAFEALNRSIGLLEQLKDSVALSSALNNLGLVYKENNDYNKALEYNLRALKISLRLNNFWEIAYISNAIGEIFLIQKNYESAEYYFKQGLRYAEKIGTLDILLYSYRSLTYYYSAIGSNAQFIDYFKKYDAIKDSIFTTQNTRSIAEMQVKYETEQKEKENAIQKLQIAKEKDLRNSFIFTSILILIAVVVIYNRYRAKRKLNIELEAKVQQRTADLLKNQVKLEEAQRIGKSGSWDWDLINNSFDWSGELEKIFCVPAERKLDIRYLLKSVHKDDRIRITKVLRRNFGNNHEFIFEFRLIAPGNNLKYITLQGEITFNNNSEPVYLQGTIQDTTDRILIEQRILRNTIETEERERTRFSEDLHDGLGPLLSTVKIHLELISARIGNPEEQQKFIRMTNELLDESIRSTREIANNLTPNLLNDFGLTEALIVYVEKINKTGAVQIDLQTGEQVQRPEQRIEAALYRILCELINNTLKHASASLIQIKLTGDKQVLRVSYSDNGIGFDIQNTLNSKDKGLGLSNIISRMKSVNGTYAFQSEPGKNFEAMFAVSLSGLSTPFPENDLN